MSTRIGVQVQAHQADFAAMRRAWQQVEELGADAIYTCDHFYPVDGDPGGKNFEGLVSLTALAACTEHVKIGGLVFCNSYRNPQLLVDAHRTVDHLANGRVILGLGAGWFHRDYDEYGYEFGTAGDRLRALGRDLPLMKERLAKLNPPPVGKMPILVAGGGEKVTLRLVAEFADLWHSFGDTTTYRRKAKILADHCASVGRDPATIEHIVDGIDDTLGLADELAAAGASELTIRLTGPRYDLGELREAIQWRDRHNSR